MKECSLTSNFVRLSLSLSFIIIDIVVIHELVHYNFSQPMLSCSAANNSAYWRPEAYLLSISINFFGHQLVALY